MKNRITPIIDKKTIVIDLENLIYISDSDEEKFDAVPTIKNKASTNVITIDQDEDNVMNINSVKSRSTTTISQQKSIDPISPSRSSQKKTKQVIEQAKPLDKPYTQLFVNKIATTPPRRTIGTPVSEQALPEKWFSSAQEIREETTTSNILLSQAVSLSQKRKLSLPRSALLNNSTLAKGPSASIKAASPLRSVSLKRPIKSPESLNLMRRDSLVRPSPLVFNTAIHGSPRPHVNRRPSFEWPSQSVFSDIMDDSIEKPEKTCYGSSEREINISRDSRQTKNAVVYELPERDNITKRPLRPTAPTAVYESPKRSTHNLSNPGLNTQPELRRPKISSSPFSKPVFQQSKVVHELYDEDDKEEDLEIFVSIMTSTRRKIQTKDIPKIIQVQCPICYLMYPKNELYQHASECRGDAVTGNKRGNTIASAVERDVTERKRLNIGKIDGGPTNYYADGESVLALDGVGFNAAASGISWESSGQTRFE